MRVRVNVQVEVSSHWINTLEVFMVLLQPKSKIGSYHRGSEIKRF